ncbi:MAG: glycosyltransferase, partial [Candidatus Omnitrophica bacterium]|nr:glycosyltransferase [Candidatus Omnitrophota bacterium]
IVTVCRLSRTHCAITVLDNQSGDESEACVARKCPEVTFVRAPENKVLCSYNAYAKEASEPFLFLLNNDIWLEPGSVDPLVEAMKRHPDALFCAPQVVGHASGEVEGARSMLGFRWGLPWGASTSGGAADAAEAYSMQTGFGVFRREAFVELGGYDELYLPGTVEDTDLCFRAYRSGRAGYYCPRSVVRHMGQASFKKAFRAGGIRRMNRRNLFLFVWKNIRSPRLWLEHIGCLPLQLVKYTLLGQWDFLGGFLDAMGRLPQALRSRQRSRHERSVRSDENILTFSRGWV